MTLQMKGGRMFNPTGWLEVQAEAIHKEAKLRVKADTVRSTIFGTTAEGITTKRPPGGWAWFTNGGFQDHFDKERIVRKRFPQQPVWDSTRPAGRPGNEAVKILAKRHALAGRDAFLDRAKDPHDTDDFGTPPNGGSSSRAFQNSQLPTLPQLALRSLPKD